MFKLRAHREMQSDPAFPYMVGRLVGAAEMATVALKNEKLTAVELAAFGDKLDSVVQWFIEPQDGWSRRAELPPAPTTTPASSDAATAIIQPPEAL